MIENFCAKKDRDLTSLKKMIADCQESIAIVIERSMIVRS